jgi:hypothetical protein
MPLPGACSGSADWAYPDSRWLDTGHKRRFSENNRAILAKTAAARSTHAVMWICCQGEWGRGLPPDAARGLSRKENVMTDERIGTAITTKEAVLDRIRTAVSRYEYTLARVKELQARKENARSAAR